MRAAKQFVMKLIEDGAFQSVDTIVVELYGSLAMTGIGHATDKAILLGLMGETPEGVDPNEVDDLVSQIKHDGKINLLKKKTIDFSYASHLIFHKGKRLPFHSNAIRFKAYDRSAKEIDSDIFYSVGGGFVVTHEQTKHIKNQTDMVDIMPFEFGTAEELLSFCKQEGMMIHEIVMENETALKTPGEVRKGILNIWDVMRKSIERGISQEGVLPGGLEVKRRAKSIFNQLNERGMDPTEFMEWVSLWALAVNEENAAGGRVVTAPTNGSAGVIPAVVSYYLHFTPNPTEEGLIKFFLTSAAIGILFKEGASISAAEMGCQGEIGVSSSMAAAGLVAALGGTNEQIENAAEIAMEHHLGMTCDPIAGLVQIPCIERNTMGAIKAINAAKLSMLGNGEHRVSLDQVILAMKQTGEEMKSTYKETSEAGLAQHVPVSVPEC
jgi:L-serine dehydratase